ncbi:MAG: polyprenyl synthetase family protein [Armatimonadetes bacterium]|nr:polyprenyl synthetase family protein [Armatimonadota bacterium]
MSIQSGLLAHRNRIESRLDELLPRTEREPKPLFEAMRYATLGGGKRLRPALAMECSRAVGGDPELALDAGCAVEIVHCFSLIHDDLPALDDDDLRRGKPTCHKVFGEAVALLAGDALFALAFEILAQAPSGIAGVLELAKGVGSAGVVGGETLDILSEGGPMNGEVLKRIHQEKTGALFACTCALGALCAGADPGQVDALRDYGASLGLAFQIADDILNETSSPEALGKAAGSDKARGKLTWPATFGIEQANADAQKWAAYARQCLENLPGETFALAELAEFAVRRDS